jgi:hypothetical protein
VWDLSQLVQYRFFQITKVVFAVTLKCLADGVTHPLLNDVVGVKERELQTPGDVSPDGGLTGAWKAN